MKPKYTTEALRENINKILTVYKPAPFQGAPPLSERRANNHQIDKLLDLFTVQQQALLDEVLKTLEGKWGGFGYKPSFNEIIKAIEAIKKEIV